MAQFQFSDAERSFMVIKYYETKSYKAVKDAFAERFSNREAPNKSTIMRNAKKYANYATSHNRNKNNSGRRRTGRSVANIAAVQNQKITLSL